MLLNITTSAASDDVILQKGDCVGDVYVAVSPKDYLTTTNEIKACERLKGKYVETELENRILKTQNKCPDCFWESTKSSIVGALVGAIIYALASK